MQGEPMCCWICGTTHGFGERCPDRNEMTQTRLREEVRRLRETLRESLRVVEQIPGEGRLAETIRGVLEARNIP